MATELAELLNEIGAHMLDEINPKAHMYVMVDLGKAAKELNHPDLVDRYKRIHVMVPLRRRPEDGVAVAARPTDFEGQIQLTSGIVVEEYLAQEAEIQGAPYSPPNKMMFGFV